jgi:serine/threonine protein kinase
MPASPVQGSLVGQRLGKYDLLALLAIGGTAEIYLARIGGEAGFEKYVVVKCLLDHLADDADFVRMFLDEARLGAQLDHSNIVQTLELGQHDGRYYMVMEHLAGMSLAQLARKTHERVPGGVIPAEIVLGLAAQACSGLHYAHQRTGNDGAPLNVVHRDVSPQNLVITFEGVLKIVDFGIAKADQRQTHTRSGTIKGKFAYMSPEQCLAEPIDRRTDVFALGTVVHELLTARRLFKRVSTYETYQAILKGNVPPPSRYNRDVDPDLDRVVLKALAYQKEDRFPNAEALGEAMLGWLHKRGKAMSASDVSRYVEKVCAQEIEEHAGHMRGLISGRQKSNTDHLRWDQEPEASEESVSLGAAPLSSEALVRGDYDEDDTSARPGDEEEDPGDTTIEPNPMNRGAGGSPAVGGFQVPKPVSGAISKHKVTADFPPVSLRPRAELPNDPPTATTELSQGMTRPEKKRPNEAPAPTGTAPPTAPTVLEMQAPVLPGQLRSPAQGYPPPGTPPPGPMSVPQTPRPGPNTLRGHTPPPQAPGMHPLAIYDTPMPVGAPPPEGWAEDSAEVLRQGLSRARPGLATPPPGPYPPDQAQTVPLWVLTAAFLVALGIGFGITVLIGNLAG